ncbi:MAG: hypothetical protein LH474_01070 [Chamaesiphon sp.]|nr:hypothetical protein [Chamaesiphon sp.]
MSQNPQLPLDDSEVQAQLIDCLLASSTITYPWNPAEPATADYYLETDRHFNLDDWSDAEITQRSRSFFAQIQSCWANSPTPVLEISPLAALIEKFGARVPQQWLAQIAANVSDLATNQLEPIDRLVQSVQDLLPNWATEDLLVIARPYAYAMRGDTGVDNIDNIVRPLAWTELSELERAKLTIAIAQAAINH